MPRQIIRYECEICHRVTDTFANAAACESRGPGKEYPVGCIFGDHTPGTIYEHITFAVAKNNIEGHVNTFAMWACRGATPFDSLGDSTCGGNITQPYTRNLDPNHPSFKRLVDYLQSERINVTVWWDGAPISLIQYVYMWNQKHNLD